VTDPLVRQAEYWNREADAFHRIYSHQKSAWSAWLDRVFRRDMYERFDFAMRESAPIEGRTFLDVGCGSGVYCLELARRGAARVTGLDIAGAMLEMAGAAAEAEGLSTQCVFVRGDLFALRPAAPFDVTLGIGLFDYVADPLPLLRRMREVTTDRVVLSFPRVNTWRAPIRKVRLALRGCPVHFYTRRRVETLLPAANLRPLRIDRVGKLYCVVATPSR
jgi:ubiquinone/menaquinone biosynthesis C-methylase UbiE